MTEHKHAAILRAIAEGKQVQYMSSIYNQWTDATLHSLNPISEVEYEWRIKPPEWQEKLRQAARDGKTVEFYRKEYNSWITSAITHYPDDGTFLKNAKESDYRIKPEPKPDVVIEFHASRDGSGYVNFTRLTINDHNLKLVFDGETNQLKSVEMI